MSKHDLLGIYKDTIRPSVESSNIIYHSLIPNYIAKKLEAVQKQAAKIIFGPEVNYEGLLQDGTLETLEERRIAGALRFALKASASPRFGPLWFKKMPESVREVRPSTRAVYKEEFCRTERSRNNPINYMTRLLNEHLSTQSTSTLAT